MAAPRASPPQLREALGRFRGPGWALVPVASIVGVIFLIRYASDSATWLTDLALVAVPILAAIALGAAMRGARPWLALLVVPLFVVAWRLPGTLEGQAAGALLSGLSCVTLGVLLSAVSPAGWLKLGIVAMSVADVWLIASDLLQHPNSVLVGAAPPAGLPQLQSESFGTVSLGYGDLFVAGLLGALCADRSFGTGQIPQAAAAALTLLVAAAFDLLFLAVNELPATVPVALVVIALEGRRVSGRRGRSRPAAATPRPGM